MDIGVSNRDSNGGSITKHLDNGKYVRYTAEQVEALERVYMECPKPSSLRRQQLIRECPRLANIEPKQIKVWFQNRRCREKQRKESSRLQTVNRKLSAMNKLLMEENDRLQKQVSQLVCENGYMRQTLQTVPQVTTDVSCESVVTAPQHSLRDANNPAGLLSVAEETLSEFLSKATGTAVDWVQMRGMKPGPDSVGIFAISHSCNGVAARACGLVSLEPTKIVEILKDRPAWLRDCRSLEVFSMLPSGNGGTIELVYTQMYAPTTLAPARDFWSLRYTTSLDNGSIVVCERSVSGSGAGPNAAASAQFVRGEMLPGGYLVRPCDGGGSIIHIVDHLNLEAWTVPEVLRPLYESSKVVAQKVTIAALRYVRQIAQETNGEVIYGLGRQPAVLRTFSQRLSRGFNYAINGFSDDGWSVMSCEGSEDVIVAVNSAKNLFNTSNPSNSHSLVGGVLCAKASMLLQNVPPAVLVRFLREHRSEWADFSVDAYSAASLKGSSYAYPEMRPTRFTGSQIIMPLGQTIEHEEMLEVIRLEGYPLSQEDAFMSRDIHLLQLCSGVDENAVGACSELVFAPIDEMFPDDAPLLPSGFRVIPLDSKSGDVQDSLTTSRTLDLASSLEVGPATNHDANDSSSSYSMRSVLTIAFQFPYENNQADSVATMARQYVRSVVSSVQRVAMAISPSGTSPAAGPKLSPGAPEAETLANWICQSHRYHMGTDLLSSDSIGGDTLLKNLWHHQDAILCCSLKSLPVFIFANQAGLDMLETTLVALHDITLDNIFDDNGRKALYSEFSKIMQQGFAYLPGGICLSTMGRHVSYEQAIAWKVLAAEENTRNGLKQSFVDGLIERAGEQHPDFPFRVLPRATNTSVFAQSFDVQMNAADRVPMQLIFLRDDVYVVSWNIRGPNPATPRYAVFSDHKVNFEMRAAAAAAGAVASASNHRKLPRVRGRGVRGRGRFLPARGEAAQPPELDTMFMVAELAKPTTYTLPISSQYGDLVRLSMNREDLLLNKYTLIEAFQVLYNAEKETNNNRLAECALQVLQMVPEPMRNARMKRALVDCFDGVGRVPKEIIDRQNQWGSSCKKLHLIPVDDSGLTDEQRAENVALIAEWTLIKANRD